MTERATVKLSVVLETFMDQNKDMLKDDETREFDRLASFNSREVWTDRADVHIKIIKKGSR